MHKIWHCGVIRYLQKKELAPKKILADMVSTLGDDAPNFIDCEEVGSSVPFKHEKSAKLCLADSQLKFNSAQKMFDGFWELFHFVEIFAILSAKSLINY